MDYLEKKMPNEEPRPTESEFMDLGKVSVETKGSYWGHYWDGGSTLRQTP